MARTKAKATKKTTVKAAPRKKTAKKAAVKTVKTTKAAEKKIAVRKPAPTTPVKTALNKSQILTAVAEHSGVSKKEVGIVFEELAGLMHRHLRKGGAGEFTVPGLLKCVVKRKPATKARKGVSPFTGEEITFKAKPARNVIKVRPLKKLKEMAD